MRDSAATLAMRGPLAFGGWLVIAGLQIGSAFALGDDDTTGEPVYRYELALSGIVLYGLLVVLTLLLARLLTDGQRAIGLRRFDRRWLLAAVGVAVLGIVVGAALEPVLEAGEEQGLVPERWEPDRAGAFAANALVIVLLGPFAEELFYRGLGIAALRFVSIPLAVLATAGLWSLAHGLLVAIPPLIVFGIALGWLRARAHSVWPAAIAHALYNAVGLSWVFVV